MTRPDVLTNLDGETVAAGLRTWWDGAVEALKDPPTLAIASAFFNADGHRVLAEILDRVGSVRLLLGTEPDPTAAGRTVRPLSDPPSAAERQRIKRALAQHQRRIIEDRDLQPFDPEADRRIELLLAWLDSGRVQVRRYEQGFLHGKAYILEGAQGGVVVGSSNLTGAGLTRNVELNLARFDAEPVGQVQDWFERLWDVAAPFDLAGLYRDRFEPADPYVVYLRMLWERYRDELDDDPRLPRELPLTRFQRDGLRRARGFLEQYGGVLISDGVGLGKTFIAGELIRETVAERRQRALVIAPAALRDGPWASFLHEFGVGYGFTCEVISFDELREDQQLIATGEVRSYDALSGEVKETDRPGRVVLRSPKEQYELIVIDEAHAFRNPATRQSDALRALLAGQPPKKVVLLSATPVNNSLMDLYELIRLFVRSDTAFLSAGIPSLRQHFLEANRMHPDTLTPDILFDVLDAIAVRRTRRFVKRFYKDDVIVMRGREVPLTFPQPVLKRIDYDFDAQMGSFFDDFAYALGADPDADDNVLTSSTEHTYDPERRFTMARYVPSRFRKDDGVELYQIQIEALLQNGLLKRFESSPAAFARTCRKMAASHDTFLRALSEGWVLTGSALKAFEADDADLDLDEFDGGGNHRADEYDATALAAAATADRDLLIEFAVAAEQVTNDLDVKLDLLIEELAGIVAEAQREAVGDQDERNRRKTLVFTYYTDTLDWIMQRLGQVVQVDPRLALLKDRIARVSGKHRDQTVVLRFAPESMGAPEGTPDLYDVLVTTDVLAEGVNLQQARNIINFDLPWNPMRLVQRHGRIDRIGSPHTRVHLRTLFPTAKLNGMLGLEATIRRKLLQAQKAMGVDGAVIEGMEASADVNFARLERIAADDADILAELEAAEALSGEEFRRELADAVADEGLRSRVAELPWVSGTGRRSAVDGYVFCARVGDSPIPRYRFVPVKDGVPDPDGISGETLRCLDLARCGPGTPLHLPEQVRRDAYAAWSVAREHIQTEWEFHTDPANLQPQLSKPVREAAELLRTNPPKGVPQAEVERALDVLSGKYDHRVDAALRDAMQADTVGEQVAAVLQVIDDYGLEPPDEIEPYPLIEADDIHLVTWMALVAG